MNKKGFVLIETLVVTIFTLFIFTILYNSIVPLLGKYKQLSYYDDLDTTYDLYYIRNMVLFDINFDDIFFSPYKVIKCSDGTLYDNAECAALFNFFDIDSTMDEVIYIDTEYIEEVFKDENISDDVKDYLKYANPEDNILLLQNDGYMSYLRIMRST